jgi:hypothetical protein
LNPQEAQIARQSLYERIREVRQVKRVKAGWEFRYGGEGKFLSSVYCDVLPAVREERDSVGQAVRSI